MPFVVNHFIRNAGLTITPDDLSLFPNLPKFRGRYFAKKPKNSAAANRNYGFCRKVLFLRCKLQTYNFDIYVNGVTLTEQNLFSKCYQFLEQKLYQQQGQGLHKDVNTVGVCRSKGCKITKLSILEVRKICRLARVELHACAPDSSPGKLDHLQTLTNRNFAAL